MVANDEQIMSRIKSICKEVLKADERLIQPASKFKEDLGADSLDTVTLLMALEEAFNSTITDEEASKLVCVQDVLDLFKNHSPAVQ